MKIVVRLENPFELTSRDVRDFVASVNKKQEYNSKILWHQHIPPEIIFTKPTQNGVFELVNYRNDIEMMEYLKRVIRNSEIYTQAGKSTIKYANLKTENFIMPKISPALAVYNTRTPIIIGSNDTDKERIRKISDDIGKIRHIAKSVIKDSIFYQIKHYLGIDVPVKQQEDVVVDVADINFFFVPYPKKEVKLDMPAVKCKVISNVILPRFVGYRIGYGFGELVVSN